jgi:hypothetical protein
MDRVYRLLNPLLIALDTLPADLSGTRPVCTLEAFFTLAAVLTKQRIVPVETIEYGLGNACPCIHIHRITS